MGDLLSEGPLPGNQPSVRLLDAGVAVTVSGAGGSRLIARTGVDPKEYFDLLGGVVPDVLLPALLLDPGQFSISGAGGADVGPFQGKVEMPPVLTNTNLGSVSIVRRASGLNLTWGPPPAGALAVAILGANYDLPTDSSAMFFCLAPAADRSFTVPPWILSAVPASRPRPYQSRGVLPMGTRPGQSGGVHRWDRRVVDRCHRGQRADGYLPVKARSVQDESSHKTQSASLRRTSSARP